VQRRIKKFRKDKVSAPQSFIANAHNELYAFYTEKGDLLKNNFEANKGGGNPTAPFEI